MRKKPELIGATIHKMIDRLDPEGHFDLVRAVQVWPEVVGETIARRTEIAEIKFHVAIVRVSSAIWIQELTMMKPQILERMRSALGNDSVRDLRFVKGTLGHRRRPRLRSVPRGVRHAIDLPELNDPELKRAFEGLIEAWGRASR